MSQSPIVSLKARRQQIVEEQKLDKAVPRWSEPEIWIRYKAADLEEVNKVAERIRKGKNTSVAIMNANIDLLSRSVEQVYAKMSNSDVEYAIVEEGLTEGKPGGFDVPLAISLGLEEDATVREMFRELFIQDGDLLQHAAALAKFSGFANDEADQTFLGS